MLGWAHIQDPEPKQQRQGQAVQQPEEDAGGGQTAEAAGTKEAQESRMVELYNEAMSAQMEGRHELAKRCFQLILESPLLAAVDAPLNENIHRRLKYLSLKNTAEILEGEGQDMEALHNFAAATEVDETDPVVWLHIGRLCEKLSRLRVARYAYESALRQHPGNWEGLEGLARVLDLVGDKAACLSVVQRALRLDATHPGMRALRSKVRKWMADPRAAAKEDMRSQLLYPPLASRRLFPDDMQGDEEDDLSGDGGAGDGSTGSGATLHITLDRSQKKHAWAELGLALLRQGRGFVGNVTVEVEEHTVGAGTRRSVPAVRVTEEQRLQALAGRKGSRGGGGSGSTAAEEEQEEVQQPQEGDHQQQGEESEGQQGGTEQQQQSGGVQGEGAGAMEEVEDDNASEAAGSQQVGRRVSRRQEERIQAREQNERKEIVTPRMELSKWMAARLEADTPQQQQQQQQQPAGRRGGSAPSWWDGDDGGPGSGLEGDGGSRLEEMDEGSMLAKTTLLPFKGVHNSECGVCGDGGDLICCETCSTVYHSSCLLRPPSLSQDLYCDRCKDDAFKKAKREPKGVSQLVLFGSEVEEIVNEFLPSAMPNLGPLDLMHRLVLRLARVREALIWEDGTVRRAALELEAASRPFARDLQVHTCHDPAQVLLDFGPEGELFLAELHLDELLTASRTKTKTKAATAGGGARARQSASPTRPEDAMQEDGSESTGDEEGSGGDGTRKEKALQAHAQACDVFLAKVFSALEAERKKKEVAAAAAEEKEQSVFHPEYLCRTFWLRGLLEAWRGRVTQAAACLEECHERLSLLAAEEHGAASSIDLPHCQRYPVLDCGVVVGRKKELLELDDTEATRRLVQAFRKGAEAARGGSAQAYQALLALVRRKFLLVADGVSMADRMRKAEDLLMDFLIHEAHTVVEAGAEDDMASWCQELDYFNQAIKHQSILWLTLMACAKRQDLSTAVVALLTSLHYLTKVDPWGNALIAKFLRVTPSLSPRVQPEVAKLNVYLSEAVSCLLSMALRQGWPKDPPTPVPALVQAVLPLCLTSLARFSLPSFSKIMLDAVFVLESAIAPLLPEERGLALSRSVFRALCGVLSDPNLSPDLLLNYTNTRAAQAYVKSALVHLVDTLDNQIQRMKRPLVPDFLSQAEVGSVVEVMCGLYRLASRSPRSYGFLNAPSIFALTMLIDQHPGLTRVGRMEWMSRAHAALAEPVVLKEVKGVRHLAAGFGECSSDGGRFLRFVLQASSDELDAEGSSRELQELAHEVTVQCLRCLYKIDIGTSNVADHQAPERRPQNLQESLVLAKFCLRYMEEEPGRSRPAMKTALRLVYQEAPFRDPLVALPRFAEVAAFLFRGESAAGEDTAPPEWLTHAKQDEDSSNNNDDEGDGVDADDPSSYGDYDKLEAAGLEDPSTMLYVYRRLYHCMLDLNPVPKRKRGAQDTDSFHLYEEDCLTSLHMQLNDLRFNPRSLSTWLSLTDTVSNLLLVYLDHCPPFTDETPSATALEHFLTGTTTSSSGGGANQVEGEQQAALHHSLEPFITSYIGYKLSPPASRLRKCLKKTPIAAFLPPETVALIVHQGEGDKATGAAAADAAATGGTSAATAAAQVATGGDPSDDLDLTWAFLVSTAYRVLLERCLKVVVAMLDRILAADPSNDRAAAQRVEMSMRMASLAYMRRYNLAKDDPRQLGLLEETLRHSQHAHALETQYHASRPRWDIPYFIGKTVEKIRRLQHPDKTYTEIEALQPGWISSFLSQYHRALHLAESKFSRASAYYRLHAARLKILRDDLVRRRTPTTTGADDAGGGPCPPNPKILKILRKYPASRKALTSSTPLDDMGQLLYNGDDDEDEDDDDENEEEQQEGGRAWISRWSIIRECLSAMVQCRVQEKWDARSVYCRARTVQQLPGWEPPPGSAGAKREDLYAGICRPGETVSEARDVMVQLFDKKRPQICALWMPDECKDHFEIVNQRNRKYESLRWRYTEYYLTLLRACEDYPRVLELLKWIRMGGGKDPSICVTRMQDETTHTLIHVVASSLSQEPVGGAQVRGLMEACYDLYLDLMEYEHQQQQQQQSDHQLDVAAARPTTPTERGGTSALLAQVEGLLISAKSKITTGASMTSSCGGGGAEGPGEQGEGSSGRERGAEQETLEAALSYCHETWPVKQGETRLGKIKGGRKRRRKSKAASIGTGGAATTAGASLLSPRGGGGGEGDSHADEEEPTAGALSKRPRTGGNSKGAVQSGDCLGLGQDGEGDEEEEEEEEVVEVLRRRGGAEGQLQQQQPPTREMGRPSLTGQLKRRRTEHSERDDDEDEDVLDDAAEGSAVSSVRGDDSKGEDNDNHDQDGDEDDGDEMR